MTDDLRLKVAAAIEKFMRGERKENGCFCPESNCEHGFCDCVKFAIDLAGVSVTAVLDEIQLATDEMLEAGRKAWKKPRLHVSHVPSDEFMTCGTIYTAMINRLKKDNAL